MIHIHITGPQGSGKSILAYQIAQLISFTRGKVCTLRVVTDKGLAQQNMPKLIDQSAEMHYDFLITEAQS